MGAIVANLSGIVTIVDFCKANATMRVEPAATDEVLVLVTEFRARGGIDPTGWIYSALTASPALAELEGVRIERLLDTPMSSEEADRLGVKYHATLVIWGVADDAWIEPYYEIPNQEMVRERLDLGPQRDVTFREFKMYIRNDLCPDYEYLILFTVGQVQFFRGEFEAAIQAYSDALAIGVHTKRPNELAAGTLHFYRGLSYFFGTEVGGLERAIDDFIKSREFEPGRADVLSVLATSHALLGKVKPAIEYASAALEITLENEHWDEVAILLVNRAGYRVCSGEREQLEKAITDYGEGIEIAQKYSGGEDVLALGYAQRGLTHKLLGEDELAEADFQRALDINTEDTFIRFIACFNSPCTSRNGSGQPNFGFEPTSEFYTLAGFSGCNGAGQCRRISGARDILLCYEGLSR
jgi:tetratricopeptide (TPR) repeat protein